MTKRSLRLLALAVPLYAAFALAPPTASATRDRPLYAGFGGGPFLFFSSCCFGEVHGVVTGEFGWHFNHEDTGFVMAVEAHTLLGPQYLGFFGGLRLGGDIEVHGTHEAGILLRPSGMFGVGLLDYQGPGNTFGMLVFEPAFDVRFVFADRLLAFWLRPVAFDILLQWDTPSRGAWSVGAAYQALAGFDFQF